MSIGASNDQWNFSGPRSGSLTIQWAPRMWGIVIKVFVKNWCLIAIRQTVVSFHMLRDLGSFLEILNFFYF